MLKSSVFAACAVIFVMAGSIAAAQKTPSYAFVSFDKNYDTLVKAARAGGYQLKEQEQLQPFGKFSVFAEKPSALYAENLYLFFNEKKELIFFTVRYVLGENQTKEVLDRLAQAIRDKFVEIYGPSESDALPYYKNIQNRYEVQLKPRTHTSPFASTSFKHLERFAQYTGFYEKEVLKLETEEISKTIKNY